MKTWLNQNFGWPIAVNLLIGLLLVYVIPPQWMRSIPGINDFLAFVPAHLPGIGRYIAVSQMPDIASVFFPVMVVFSPLFIFEIWRQPRSPERWVTDFWGRPVANFFRFLLVCIFTVGIGWVTYFVGGYELNAFPVNSSPISLALLGGISAGGSVWLCIGLFTRAIYSIFSKELRK